MKTPLTTLLNIQFPIVQAPIGSATNPILASEVSNAGGLGMLALSWKSEQECTDMIQATKKRTINPFGVNLVLAWNQEKRVEICIREKVPVVTFFWGDATPFIKKLQEHQVKIGQTVSNAEEAVYYEEKGVDFLIAQGWEAGGHVKGTVASSVLVPAIAAKVNIPVVASGGFTNGEGLIAALTLGAAGISMGTRFLMSKEASIEANYADSITKATENDTTYAKNLFYRGWENAPHRVLTNSTVKKWEKAGKPKAGHRPDEQKVIGYKANQEPILNYSDNNPIQGTTGNLEAMALYAGQSAGLLKDRIPARQIIEQTIADANSCLKKLDQFNL